MSLHYVPVVQQLPVRRSRAISAQPYLHVATVTRSQPESICCDRKHSQTELLNVKNVITNPNFD